METRSHALAWHRIIPLAIVGVLAVWGLLYFRGPAVLQRQYYPLRYEHAIEASAIRHRVSPYLIAAVITAESGWDPEAQSQVGASGLMQVMPSTAEELARRGLVDQRRFDPTDLENPETNIEYGAAYLRYLVERYHEIEIALAAYNAGLANADTWAREGGDIREHIEFPETRRFVLKVARGKDRYEALYPDEFERWRSK